jgi:hypothetical protein
MTRMWGVDPKQLCEPRPKGNNHLLGEHNELHQAVGTILRHPHGRAVIEGRVAPKVDGPDQIDTSLIQERHDKLAKEIIRRGHNHNSPMDFEDEWGLGNLDIEANKQDLKSRCDYCFN